MGSSDLWSSVPSRIFIREQRAEDEHSVNVHQHTLGSPIASGHDHISLDKDFAVLTFCRWKSLPSFQSLQMFKINWGLGG